MMPSKYDFMLTVNQHITIWYLVRKMEDGALKKISPRLASLDEANEWASENLAHLESLVTVAVGSTLTFAAPKNVVTLTYPELTISPEAFDIPNLNKGGS